MQRAVFNSSFFCKYCDKDVPMRVFGSWDSSFPESKDEEQEAKEWANHYHWIDNHRRCAICGEIVKSIETGEDSLELAVREEVIKINPLYKKETEPEQSPSSFLIVHYLCLKKHKHGNTN